MRRPSGTVRRERPTRAFRPRVLVACEGTRTEPLYLAALARELRIFTLTIAPHRGTDPRSVVDAAIAARAKQVRDRAWDPRVDTAWALADVDDWRRDQPHNWNDAVQRAGSQGVRLAVSHPCFELWYLLHFQDHTAPTRREEVLRALRRHLPDYERNTPPDPHLHVGRDRAIERARRLAAQCVDDDPHPNPSTGVFELVEVLFGLAEP